MTASDPFVSSSPAAADPSRYLELFESLSPLVGAEDVEAISLAAVGMVGSLLDVANCSILLHDPAADELVLTAATHIAPGEWPSVRLPVDRGICATCFETGRSILLTGEADFKRYDMRANPDYGVASCVVAPLIEAEPHSAAGVINIAHPRASRPFNAGDVKLIEAAARLIGAGIRNARRRAEAARSHQRLEEILSGLHVGLIAMDGRGRVTHVNRRLRRIFDLGETPFAGMKLDRVLDLSIYNVCRRLIREAREGALPTRDRVRTRVGERELHLQIVVARPSPPASSTAARPPSAAMGEGAEWLLMFEDVGRDEELERLIAADSAKRAFLRIISHELRTPLTVIQGAAPLLKSVAGEVSGAAAETLTKVERLVGANVRKMSCMINTILDVVEIENGTMKLVPAELDLNELVARQIEARESALGERRLTSAVELDRRLPPLVGDRHRLIQTVSELINNAIKFADAGSRVTVRTRREAEEAVVEVASVGPAIGTEEREGLFEKFHQMDQSNTRRSGGFGLGLYLARSIAVMHGGSIGIVEGTRPEETVFQVRLPVDAARLASAAIGQA